ncbi:MAG TPA: alanine--tRNA ligase, partial [Prosthecobacter sp.]|nr:alanine--tRNA ligase [Prosthecobacter sp.]
GLPTRAADTQKCIRAGGKHNDLEDVGLDTYHHTLFEMLGNWSFGDYFKKEAIAWAWELVIERWKFPPTRVYATIYQPDKSKGDPADRDQEAWEIWAEKFRSIGLDPDIHIVNGNKKDNFWMMGDTGPCGPCTEIHIDLTPGTPELDEARQREGRKLVNGSDASCIEIWNNVFIQYNATPEGTFEPLPAKHVDTGMGFERVCSIIQGTKNFTDFQNAKISNYDTDVFRPIFDELTKMSGKTYASTLPKANEQGHVVPVTEQEKIDVAFRVIADHIRTLSFAIADGIQPGNSDRNYTLRRILRRAVKYGRTLGFDGSVSFFFKLVDVLADQFRNVFPNVHEKREHIKAVLKLEEEAFNRTLDKGTEDLEGVTNAIKCIQQFLSEVPGRCSELEGFIKKKGLSVCGSQEEQDKLWKLVFSITKLPVDFDAAKLAWDGVSSASSRQQQSFESALTNWQLTWTQKTWGLYDAINDWAIDGFTEQFFQQNANRMLDGIARAIVEQQREVVTSKVVSAEVAFRLYDQEGFPLDLTELMARERGLTVDTAGFEELMDQQRARARAAMKKNVVSVSEIETKAPTKFIGYDNLEADVKVLEVVEMKDKTAVVLDVSTCYAEMGGQIGDAGQIILGANTFPITATTKVGNTWLHFLGGDEAPPVDVTVKLVVDAPRRHAIERHHTVTHILHWALHEVVSKDATQKGSSVTPDKLTFDFNSAALTAQQLADIERLVNERIVANDPVSWSEVPYVEAKANNGIMALFGEKYGDLVRVVQIGGQPHKLDGWSMELCGGTHTRHTGEIGLFRLVGEGAVAAGVRRIEAIAGLEAYNAAKADSDLLKLLAGKVSAQGTADLEKKLDQILTQQKELEKALKAAQQREASGKAKELLASVEDDVSLPSGERSRVPLLVANLGDVDADYAMAVNDALKGQFPGVIVLAATGGGSVALIANVSKDLQSKVQAGKIIQTIAPIVGGKGGGKPDFARGGGKDVSQVDAALAEARKLVG